MTFRRKHLTVPAVVILALAFLVGCSSAPEAPAAAAAPVARQAVTQSPTPAVTATSVADASTGAPGTGLPARAGGNLTYTGDVRAKAQVAIVPKVAGQVVALNVAVGDSVAAGAVLAQVEHEMVDAQVRQAEAAVAAAQALVAQAEAGVAAAEANARRVEEGPKPSEKYAAAKAVEAAQAAYNRLKAGPTQEDLIPLATQLAQAEAALKLAQAQYDKVKDVPMVGMLPQSLQLEQATLTFQAAKALYEKAVKGATEDQLKAAEAQLAQSRATNEKAQEGTPASVIDAARAQVAQAQAAVSAAHAQVQQAEAALALAQLNRANATIKSPIAGQVAQVNTSVGAMASPQSPQPLMVIVSPEVEVVFSVDEAALALVAVGNALEIRVDAYPDRSYPAKIARISPVVNPANRTVEVTAIPDATDGTLRVGMFATVILLGKE